MSPTFWLFGFSSHDESFSCKQDHIGKFLANLGGLFSGFVVLMVLHSFLTVASDMILKLFQFMQGEIFCVQNTDDTVQKNWTSYALW